MSQHVEIPFTVNVRPDTGIYNGKLGIRLFPASEVMLFGALFSSLILLRTSAMTGLHGLHVLAGMVGFGYFLTSGAKMWDRDRERFTNRIEIVGLYWHFVDLVWIFLPRSICSKEELLHHSPSEIRREIRGYLVVFIALAALTGLTVFACFGLFFAFLVWLPAYDIADKIRY